MLKKCLSSKNIFWFTLTLFVINVGIFMMDRLLGFTIFGWGILILTPLVIITNLVDRYYLKNKNGYFFANIIFLIAFWYLLSMLVQSYSDSVINMI